MAIRSGPTALAILSFIRAPTVDCGKQATTSRYVRVKPQMISRQLIRRQGDRRCPDGSGIVSQDAAGLYPITEGEHRAPPPPISVAGTSMPQVRLSRAFATLTSALTSVSIASTMTASPARHSRGPSSATSMRMGPLLADQCQVGGPYGRIAPEDGSGEKHRAPMHLAPEPSRRLGARTLLVTRGGSVRNFS